MRRLVFRPNPISVFGPFTSPAESFFHSPNFKKEHFPFFLRILENSDQIGAIECNKMRSYIVIIVRNIALDQLRQQNRRGELPLPQYGDDLQDDGIDLEQDLLDREQAADIHAHMRALGQPFLDIMILKMVHGFKSREISRMLQIPESTVRVYLQRGKKRLMKKLEGEGDVDPVQA